jgi:hypothetical protein
MRKIRQILLPAFQYPHRTGWDFQALFLTASFLSSLGGIVLPRALARVEARRSGCTEVGPLPQKRQKKRKRSKTFFCFAGRRLASASCNQRLGDSPSHVGCEAFGVPIFCNNYAIQSTRQVYFYTGPSTLLAMFERAYGSTRQETGYNPSEVRKDQSHLTSESWMF